MKTISFPKNWLLSAIIGMDCDWLYIDLAGQVNRCGENLVFICRSGG